MSNEEDHEAGESQIDFSESKSVAVCSFILSLPMRVAGIELETRREMANSLLSEVRNDKGVNEIRVEGITTRGLGDQSRGKRGM